VKAGGAGERRQETEKRLALADLLVATPSSEIEDEDEHER
jgi:hypothetical protein